MNNIIIEVLGWIGSVLIVGAYFMNIRGKWKASEPLYIWFNFIGGVFFVINTIYHAAYPSAIVNVIWVIIAIAALLRRK